GVVTVRIRKVIDPFDDQDLVLEALAVRRRIVEGLQGAAVVRDVERRLALAGAEGPVLRGEAVHVVDADEVLQARRSGRLRYALQDACEGHARGAGERGLEEAPPIQADHSLALRVTNASLRTNAVKMSFIFPCAAAGSMYAVDMKAVSAPCTLASLRVAA